MMQTKSIDGKMFTAMVKNASAELNRNRAIVNDLNVFPVPDGDTGDNMFMTIDNGAKSVGSDSEGQTISEVASKVARGMFMGARGNSGVILSRIFSGISKGLEGLAVIDIPAWGKAMAKGVEESYQAVSKPAEGTILTVFREATEVANSQIGTLAAFEQYFDVFEKELHASLERTPDLLPVLKEAGVVDSGGAGLLYIFSGISRALEGIDLTQGNGEGSSEDKNQSMDLSSFNENSDLTYGYCTEFLLQLLTSKVGDVSLFNEQVIFDYINSAGDSVVAFRNGSIIKVHVHTKTPGEILNTCQKWGEFLTLKIENMTLQHNETIVQNRFEAPKKSRHKKYATVCVACGEGIIKTFEDLGVDIVVRGGQSMNPSVGDFVQAFEALDAENIIVFPNNGNVIFTAKQAAESYDKSNVIVIANHSIGEGYAALSTLDTSSNDTEAIVDAINANIESVVTGEVSIATRDTEQNGIQIRKDSYIGFSSDTIHTCTDSARQCAAELAQSLDMDSADVCLLIYGEMTPAEEAQEVLSEFEDKYPMTEFILIDGKQPIYNYIMVLEN